MAKAKYDPLEAAKLGTDAPSTPGESPFVTAASPPPPPKAPSPPAPDQPTSRPKYRLLESKRVSVRGQLCDFKAGRIFDSAGYDIENLKSQGLQLELIKE